MYSNYIWLKLRIEIWVYSYSCYINMYVYIVLGLRIEIWFRSNPRYNFVSWYFQHIVSIFENWDLILGLINIMIYIFIWIVFNQCLRIEIWECSTWYQFLIILIRRIENNFLTNLHCITIYYYCEYQILQFQLSISILNT